MRYKFYREHKYLSFRLDELEHLVAKTDFRQVKELNKVKEEFEKLTDLLLAHAQYENDSLHSLLKIKNSSIYQNIEQDHAHLDAQINYLQNLLNKIGNTIEEEDKIEAGYQFYLWFRKFSGDNLIHLHEEETIILPELQKLYSDTELREVDAKIYQTMTTQELVDMIDELFPHMNITDWKAFLFDIKYAVPERFLEIWKSIRTKMDNQQKEYLTEILGIITNAEDK